ncbi:ERV/ALR sulfhydryl oxidase [Fadolivirus algeromassiliense]|jgi:hypothetical protein|uniref:Sulfhydryl oxidase n=1 Tax=Fadolivirus FV1/VV64 TaxID=3070911 RepID=A0A7D3QVE6_9VIRU|nr:ERV/ALR sulfhydryl oxidase [Fadolivirus algeromassiliense]QKF93519.1 ERV/ALR sulfhydryl oxidase [Fadolivirus FV1/VV64]
MADMWKELHLRALSKPSFVFRDEKLFVKRWSAGLNNKGCECKNPWRGWLKANPVDINDYFAWTVRAHNAVNAKLGKPTQTVEEAREYWENYIKSQTTQNK